MDLVSTNMMKKKKKKKKKTSKGRFSNEQIKSLESIFEFDSKLEPSKKLQIAKELGLQPQQVAIWFQNRRARWKSKQLERDYGLLKANYDDLAARFESLKKEKQSLLMQLQKLGDQIRKTREENGSCDLGLAENCTNCNLDNREPDREPEMKPTLLHKGLNLTSTSSRNENSTSMEYYRDEEEPEFMSVREPAYEVLTSHENRRYFDSCDLFDQSSCSSNSQWWEFWP